MAGENWTFWLNMTNIALGVITVLALLVVLGAVGWDLLARTVRKARETHSLGADLRAMLHADSHALSVPGLGLTMADGGERIKPSEAASSEEKPRRK
ncbi:MAG: hypothetical protein ACLQOO_24740 [Terriglobia bacterium]